MTDRFYKFPKHWLTDEPFCDLDRRALVLLMKLRDLVEVAEHYDQIENGKPYVSFTVEQIAKLTKVTHPTAQKIKNMLVENGLIFTQKNGQKNADKIFIHIEKLEKVSKEILPSHERNLTNNEEKSVKNFSEVSKNSLKSQLNSFQKSVKNFNSYNNYTRPNTRLNNKTTTTSNISNNIFKIAESEFGRLLSPFEIQDLSFWKEEFSDEMILEAIKETKLNGKTNLKYLSGILRNWRDENITTVEQVKASKSKKPLTKEEWRQSLKEPDPRYGF